MTAQRRSRQDGFSLTELMLAMLVGLFLLAGLIYTYLGASRNYAFNEAMSRIQENGRFAVLALSRDIRAAGFMGCAQHVGHIEKSFATLDNYRGRYTIGIEAYDNVGSSWPGLLEPVLAGQPVDGSDIITIRSARQIPASLVTAVSGASGSFRISVTNKLVAGDLLMVTDCTDAAIFHIASDQPGSDGVVKYVTSAADDNDWGRSFGRDSQLLSLRTSTYYLKSGSTADLPSLWRTLDGPPAQELVRGVEDMQILYGTDTDNDRMADIYIDAAAVASHYDWADVVSVRIALLLVSLQEVTQQPVSYQFDGSTSMPDDHRIRLPFIATVTLRNRSP